MASISIQTAPVSISEGDSATVSAVLRDAAGKQLSGLIVTWSTTDPAVVSISSSGSLVALKPGIATVRADHDGKSATTDVTVTAPTISRVIASPSYLPVDQAQHASFGAMAVDSRGRTIRGAAVRWSSAQTTVAGISADGRATALAPGVARLVAQAGEARDTTVIAVLGAKSLLLTVLPGGSHKASAKPGEVVSVPIRLDLSRASSTGDLGSLQFDLFYDPAVLEFVSSKIDVAAPAAADIAEPGRIRFALAATSSHGRGDLALATLTFRVSATATSGTERKFTVRYAGQPTSSRFEPYEIPITVEGAVRVSRQ